MGIVIVVAIVVALVLGFLFLKARTDRRVMLEAAAIHSEISALWAAQGPFVSGEVSANAMRRAHAAVRGADSIREASMIEAFDKHELAYDKEPQTWESLRQDSLPEASGPKFEELFWKVKLFAATDSLEPRINAASLLDAPRKSAAEIGEGIANSVGENLMSTGTEESKELIAFLADIFLEEYKKAPETPGDFGLMWCGMLNYSNENPEVEISKEFKGLNDRWYESKM